MPVVRIQGVGNVRFPDSMSDDEINHAIETDILSPRAMIAMRDQGGTTPTSRGNPVSGQPDIGVGDVAGAMAKGVAGMVGIPTSMSDVPEAAKSALLNLATAGGYSAVKAGTQMAHDVAAPAMAYASGQAPTAEQNASAVPVVGRAAYDVARPALAVAQGNAPTRDENLGAVQSGTQLAATAAMMHPAVGAAIAKVMPQVGAAIEDSGTATRADTMAPPGSPNRPLAETIGSQLNQQGSLARTPEQLGNAFGGTQDIQFKFDKNTTSLKDLQAKYPGETITKDGNNYTINQPNEGSVNQQAANKLGADLPTPDAMNWWAATKKYILPGSVGGKIGAMVGGPVGAAVGVAVSEAPAVVSAVVQSPLFRATSGVVKTALGRAMQTQSMATVTNIAAKVLGGVNLEDKYGHDDALFNLMQQIPTDVQTNPPALHQALQDYTAVYVNPDASSVQVPNNLMKSTIEQLSGGAHSMVQKGQ
jgi:hypothetical protein